MEPDATGANRRLGRSPVQEELSLAVYPGKPTTERQSPGGQTDRLGDGIPYMIRSDPDRMSLKKKKILQRPDRLLEGKFLWPTEDRIINMMVSAHRLLGVPLREHGFYAVVGDNLRGRSGL